MEQKIIIVVVNFGTPDLLKELLDNFIASLPRFPRLRIDWVVMDAQKKLNPPNSIYWETDFKQNYKNKKRNFFHFFQVENQGFARNVNLGYMLFRRKLGNDYKPDPSDLLMLVNPDTSLFWPTLEKAIHFMNFTSQAMVAGLALVSPKGEREKWGHSVTFPSLKSFKLLLKGKRFSEPISTNEPTPVAWVSGGAMLIRIFWWEKLKGLSESYYFYFEDVDFCRRTHMHSGKVYFLPNITINHRRGGSPISIYRRKQYFYASEAHYFYTYRNPSEYFILKFIRIPFLVYYFFRCYFAPSFWINKINKTQNILICEKKEGFPQVCLFWESFWKLRHLKEFWAFSFLLMFSIIVIAVWGNFQLSSPIVLHYNAYLGIDAYGEIYQLYAFPFISFFVALFNFTLGTVFLFSQRYAAFSILPAGANMAFQTTILIALVNLILVNRAI
ncbi:MAG: glycosyltransferase family 2 protein [Candidatus Moranbacteria bacterium]|nr:glycosyltransferase family 2 protein [Candidatus Moranbacteria bacterium]